MQNGAYTATLTDRATNQTTVPFTVTRDATAPTVTFALPERIAASDIPVQWSASDAGSGVQYYDVEYQIANGDWTPWLTATTQMQATFTGTLGVAYTFRVRATDRVSNTSAWVQAEARTVVVKKYYTVAGQRVAMRENGVVYWLHSDHLGSTSLTTDQSGNVVAAQKYLPYGEVRWVTGTLPTDLTYTGQRSENGLGLMDYRARFYSPRLGRFLSADTLVPGVGSAYLNRYMYTNGNPVRYNDPSGHCMPGDDGCPSRMEEPLSGKSIKWELSIYDEVINQAPRGVRMALGSIPGDPDKFLPGNRIIPGIKGDSVIPPVDAEMWDKGQAGGLGYKSKARNDRNHPGVDRSLGRSTYVVSVASGVITRIRFDEPGYGWYVEVQHDIDGKPSTVYGHLATGSPAFYGIKEGDRVSQGQVLGVLCVPGDTCGEGTFPHLHFEARKNVGRWMLWSEFAGDPAEVDKYFYDPVEFVNRNGDVK